MPVTADDPLPTSDLPVIATLAPQHMTVGSVAVGLPDLGAANAVTVHVVSSSGWRSVGGTPAATTPGLSVGDSESLRGVELAACRLIRDGSSDAVLWLEPRVVG